MRDAPGRRRVAAPVARPCDGLGRALRRARRALALALGALGLLRTSLAAADEPACDRPALTLLRYDEDYSFLRSPRCRTDPWDPLKYIPLSDRLPVYLSLGIDVRERFEFFDTMTWGGEPEGRSVLMTQRVMPHAAANFGEHVQLFFEATSNLVLGSDPRPLDRDDLDVLQAFASATFGPLTLRGGRQEIQYADSRLVSVREGPNVRLAFDGVRLIQKVRKWQVDAFGLVPVQVRPGVFDDRPEPGQSFWGIYATGPLRGEYLGLDLYYLGRLREVAEFEQGTDRERRHTIGARVWGDPGGFDYNVETAYQAGAFGSGTIAAWMAASNLGYTGKSLPLRPRLGIQVNAASGDSSPERPALQTFNPLFPRGVYFSQANLIGPLNIVDVHPALTLNPFETLSILLDWDFFWRESLGDGLYLPSTALQIPGADNPERYIGSQGAALIEWLPTRHASFAATYSHFFPGAFLRRAQRREGVDFVALWASYAF